MSVIGLKVGPYEVVDTIAVPEPGDWYLGRRGRGSRRTPSSVYVRVLPPQATREDRVALQQQFDILRTLDDPRVPAPQGYYDGLGALAVAAPEGTALSEAIERVEAGLLSISLATASAITVEVAATLLHGIHRGALHTTLDPSMIWVAKDGTIVVWGFGIDGPNQGCQRSVENLVSMMQGMMGTHGLEQIQDLDEDISAVLLAADQRAITNPESALSTLRSGFSEVLEREEVSADIRGLAKLLSTPLILQDLLSDPIEPVEIEIEPVVHKEGEMPASEDVMRSEDQGVENPTVVPLDDDPRVEEFLEMVDDEGLLVSRAGEGPETIGLGEVEVGPEPDLRGVVPATLDAEVTFGEIDIARRGPPSPPPQRERPKEVALSFVMAKWAIGAMIVSMIGYLLFSN